MGIRVDYIDGLADAGLYYNDERRVEIRNGLHPDIERSVLAHEAMHAELRHEPQEIWCREMRNERMASAMAGRNLIDYHEMVRLQTKGLSEKEMCKELGGCQGNPACISLAQRAGVAAGCVTTIS